MSGSIVPVSQSSILMLDAWPVLEWLKGRDPAKTKFRELLLDAEAGRLSLEMSRINHGEVRYSIIKDFPSARVSSALKALDEIPLLLHSVDDTLIDEAVVLKGQFKISYADAFAAAQAIRRNLPLVTGDKELRALETAGLVQLHWLGA